jgi:bifunctional UDP-N-acetylglucosamine pyrophosphorylase/glucosamine-1-phosphate N-acetyltransferase
MTTARSRAIILAAGKGSRMRSDLPKVLHPFLGRPLIAAALEAGREACGPVTVVVGHQAERVRAALPEGVQVAEQAEQRGTGHAVACAITDLHPIEESVVVVAGDHPFLSARSMRALTEARAAENAEVAMATLALPDFEGVRAQFEGCGRILRGADGAITGIVERKVATAEQAAITEVNVSYYCFRGPWLKENVTKIVLNDAVGEYYLTDLVAAAVAQGGRVAHVALDDFREGMGVNTPEQLLAAEALA